MAEVIDPNTGESQRSYRDMRKLAIEPNDLIVLRTDVEWTVEDMMKFDEQMHTTYPDWGGSIIMMRTDESLEKVPAGAVRALYEQLRAQFDPDYDAWKKEQGDGADVAKSEDKVDGTATDTDESVEAHETPEESPGNGVESRG